MTVRSISRGFIEIDLDGIARNAKMIGDVAGVPIVAMVKADGYGLGAIQVARKLEQLGEMVWGFGVATIDEAGELVDAGINGRILCFTPLLPEQLASAKKLGVRPSLHRPQDIALWKKLSGGPWHLAIDTGMSRAGIGWTEITSLAESVSDFPPEAVFTHFHSADLSDVSMSTQTERFEGAVRELGKLPGGSLRHLRNSAAVGRSIGAEEGAGDLARSGIALYGVHVSDQPDVENVVTMRAAVVDVRTIQQGETVGYEGTFTAQRESRIATVAAGYGDGYRRALSNRAAGLLGGKRVPVAGIVSMDMTTFDVTDTKCAVGDLVTLIGRDGDDEITVDEIARLGAISPYELLVGLKLRLPRVYKGGGEC